MQNTTTATTDPTKDPKDVTPAPESKMISIEREKLAKILDRLDRLESAASKAALHKYDDDHKEDLGQRAGVKVYEGKRIISYVMTKNICEKNPNGAWVEDQAIELTYEDGKKQEIPYKLFATRYTLEQGEVISKKTLQRREDIALNGEFMFELQMKDGETLEVGSKYLNG